MRRTFLKEQKNKMIDSEWQTYLALQEAGPLVPPRPAPGPAPWENQMRAESFFKKDPTSAPAQSLRSLLEGRRSSRILWNPLNLSDLHQLLSLALLSTTRRPPYRPYPTSGASDELGLLVAARKVRGLEEGAYWVSTHGGGVSLSPAASLDDRFAAFERRAAPFQGFKPSRPPAASLLVLADWRRLGSRYANCVLASGLWDAGTLLQTLSLAAFAVDLHACISACVQPRLIEAWLQLDCRDIGHIGTLALGGPVREERSG
jgi:oxazoline/thiazoline dehydrogenase